MTTISKQLVLVGGITKNFFSSSDLGVWNKDSNQWTHPLPRMPMPRQRASATSYKHWLVVAGGLSHRHHNCIPVDVLDVDKKQWSVRASTVYLPRGNT